MNRRLLMVTMAVGLSLTSGTVWGQSLKERIANLKDRPRQEDDAPAGPSIAQRLAATLDPVHIANTPAKQAFEWWSKTTGVSLVISWETMQTQGIDPDRPINLDLRNVPAGSVLALLMQQTATQQEALIFESTPWYVQIMTKTEANKHNVVRIYVVSDILFEAPDFGANAPSFNLTSNNTSTSAGGGSSGGSGSGTTAQTPFTAPTSTPKDTVKATQDNADKLIDIIKKTIEPTVWDTAGGQSSIKYLQGKLIVSAPPYVQRQIGMPSVSSRSSSAAGVIGAPAPATPTDGKAETGGKGDRAAGVDKSAPNKVSQVAK